MLRPNLSQPRVTAAHSGCSASPQSLPLRSPARSPAHSPPPSFQIESSPVPPSPCAQTAAHFTEDQPGIKLGQNDPTNATLAKLGIETHRKIAGARSSYGCTTRIPQKHPHRSSNCCGEGRVCTHHLHCLPLWMPPKGTSGSYDEHTHSVILSVKFIVFSGANVSRKRPCKPSCGYRLAAHCPTGSTDASPSTTAACDAFNLESGELHMKLPVHIPVDVMNDTI